MAAGSVAGAFGGRAIEFGYVDDAAGLVFRCDCCELCVLVA